MYQTQFLMLLTATPSAASFGHVSPQAVCRDTHLARYAWT